jgi:hypothetical protein
MTEAQLLFIKKHEAFHAMREVVEGKSMTKEDWIILRLLKASTRTQAIAHPDYVRSIMYLMGKHGVDGLNDGITKLQEEDKR